MEEWDEISDIEQMLRQVKDALIDSVRGAEVCGSTRLETKNRKSESWKDVFKAKVKGNGNRLQLRIF